MLSKIGPNAYLVGVLVAVLAGILTPGYAAVPFILAALGLIVGLLNVKDKYMKLFLIAVIAFLLSVQVLEVFVAKIPTIGFNLGVILSYLVWFTAPAAAIVALQAIHLSAGEANELFTVGVSKPKPKKAGKTRKKR